MVTHHSPHLRSGGPWVLLPPISLWWAGTGAALHILGTTHPYKARDGPTSRGSCSDCRSNHIPVLKHTMYHHLRDSKDTSGERLKSFQSQQPDRNELQLG